MANRTLRMMVIGAVAALLPFTSEAVNGAELHVVEEPVGIVEIDSAVAEAYDREMNLEIIIHEWQSSKENGLPLNEWEPVSDFQLEPGKRYLLAFHYHYTGSESLTANTLTFSIPTGFRAGEQRSLDGIIVSGQPGQAQSALCNLTSDVELRFDMMDTQGDSYDEQFQNQLIQLDGAGTFVGLGPLQSMYTDNGPQHRSLTLSIALGGIAPGDSAYATFLFETRGNSATASDPADDSQDNASEEASSASSNPAPDDDDQETKVDTEPPVSTDEQSEGDDDSEDDAPSLIIIGIVIVIGLIAGFIVGRREKRKKPSTTEDDDAAR